MEITRIQALKQYFSTPEKPLTNSELIELRKADPKGFNELAALVAKELGATIISK